MGSQPWFKKWAGDYLSDSKIRLLTYEQRGILETLWAFAWQDGGIPSSPDEQSILLGIPVKAMRTHSVWIARFFAPNPTDASKLVSPRMELERIEAEAKSGKARESAMQRWSKGNANAHANALEPHIPTQCEQGCGVDANPMLSVSVSESEIKTTPLAPKGGTRKARKEAKLSAFPVEVVSLVGRLLPQWPTQRDGKTFRNDDVAAASNIDRILRENPDANIAELEQAALGWLSTNPEFPNSLENFFGPGKPGKDAPWVREVRAIRTRLGVTA